MDGARRLRPEVAVHALVEDRTAFGSPLSTRPDQATRDLFAAVMERARELPPESLAVEGPALLAAVVGSPDFLRVADRHDEAWRLRPDVLFPDPDLARFSSLQIAGGDSGIETAVPAESWAGTRRLTAALAGAGVRGDEPWLDRHTGMVLERLVAAGLTVDADDQGDTPTLPDGPCVSFPGHSTVVVRSATTTAVVDPFLPPARDHHPRGYHSLSWRDLGSVDAVLITHCHPDHFDPGTLLQIDPRVPVIVPRLDRETLLSVDLRRRLAELGSDRVIELGWWDHHRVGDTEITALPFYGEQPTDGPVLHPDVRNAGNTYLVGTPGFSVALIADSGRDAAGDVRDVADEARRRYGPPDVLFAGYRGWSTYPLLHLFSSVARYLLFVPPEHWGARLELMCDPTGAVDVAERWGAALLVPYADGGAPWFWEMGLGPRLDENPRSNESVDPPPERVVEAARHRVERPDSSWVTSPVEVLLMRPNDSLVELGSDRPVVVGIAGNSWPYDD